VRSWHVSCTCSTSRRLLSRSWILIGDWVDCGGDRWVMALGP
jgi:hypothetical protein